MKRKLIQKYFLTQKGAEDYLMYLYGIYWSAKIVLWPVNSESGTYVFRVEG